MSRKKDRALEEYKQQLWHTIQKTKHPRDRAILQRELERLNEQGREALKKSLTAE